MQYKQIINKAIYSPPRPPYSPALPHYSHCLDLRNSHYCAITAARPPAAVIIVAVYTGAVVSRPRI